MIPEGFHFLRPAWLLALVPLGLVLWAAARRDEQASAWRRLVDQHLLRHLLLDEGGATRRWPLVVATLGGAAACLAMAGPAWERVPQPTFSAIEPTVVVLEMSPTMGARDLSPSRLARARHKLHDVLARTRGGQVGLVIYADEPFVASPLTDDARVIEEMIPALERGIMPPRRGRADRAILEAQALLDQAGAATGRIVLLSDGIDDHADDALAAARAVQASGRTLSVIGAGTAEGTPPLDRSGLEALAAAGGGTFAVLSVDDADLARVVPAATGGSGAMREPTRPDASTPAGSTAGADVWRDAGIWLVLVPLVLAPLAFRRGLLAGLALTLLLAAPARAEASTWTDLWSRRDQQAQAALAAGETERAAQLFEDPAWQAAARYEAGDFAESVEAYQSLSGAENRYNLGNALARSGELEQAVAAYDEVLASAPDHADAKLDRAPVADAKLDRDLVADAKFNRDLVQQLLDQQRQQQEQQQGQGQQDRQQDGQGQDAAQGESGQDDAQGEQGSAQQEQQSPQAGQDAASSESANDAAGGSSAERQADADGASGGAPDDAAQQQEQLDAQHDTQQDTQQDARQAAAPGEPGEERGESAASSAADAGTDPAGDERRAEAQDGGAHAQPDDAAAKGDRSLERQLDSALDGEDGSAADAAQAAAATSDAQAHPMSEREQANEQVLRNIPDDPGGLLRAKIRRRYAEKRYSQQEVISPW